MAPITRHMCIRLCAYMGQWAWRVAIATDLMVRANGLEHVRRSGAAKQVQIKSDQIEMLIQVKPESSAQDQWLAYS